MLDSCNLSRIYLENDLTLKYCELLTLVDFTCICMFKTSSSLPKITNKIELINHKKISTIG